MLASNQLKFNLDSICSGGFEYSGEGNSKYIPSPPKQVFPYLTGGPRIIQIRTCLGAGGRGGGGAVYNQNTSLGYIRNILWYVGVILG